MVAYATLALLCYCISANQTPPPAQKPKFSKEQRIDKAIEQEFEKTKDPKLNTVPRERLKDARKVARQKLTLKNAAPSLNWQERGPDNVGGRTRAILFDRNDQTQSTVFAAGVSGGLWKTTNIKSTNPNWQAINDFFQNIAVTCIIQDTLKLLPMVRSTLHLEFARQVRFSNQHQVRETLGKTSHHPVHFNVSKSLVHPPMPIEFTRFVKAVTLLM